MKHNQAVRKAKARNTSAEKKTKKSGTVNPTSSSIYTHWLLKSEPESRFENGVDVKVHFRSDHII